MTVRLRQRKKGNRISLFLEYYSRGRREYEYLQLYLHPEPVKGKLSKEDLHFIYIFLQAIYQAGHKSVVALLGFDL